MDYHVIRVLGNKVEVKDNNGKMSWFHISDVKKTDMINKINLLITRLQCIWVQGKAQF